MLGELSSQKLRSYQTTRRYVRKDGSTLHALVYVATARLNRRKAGVIRGGAHRSIIAC